MGFHEYWLEQQRHQAAEQQAAIERARSWLGRRVWCSNPYGGPACYGEVAYIDTSGGKVLVLVGYDQQDQPVYRTYHVTTLGRSVWLADE